MDLVQRLEFAAANTTMLSARPLLREAANAVRWWHVSEKMPPDFAPVIGYYGPALELVVCRTSCVNGERVWFEKGRQLWTPEYWREIHPPSVEQRDA